MLPRLSPRPPQYQARGLGARPGSGSTFGELYSVDVELLSCGPETEDALCTFGAGSRPVALRGDAARRCDELRDPGPSPLMDVPLSAPDTGKADGCALV
eukprot:COSAG05_NODE_232_length_13313_cov_677.565991_7_plen_99_part_00